MISVESLQTLGLFQPSICPSIGKTNNIFAGNVVQLLTPAEHWLAAYDTLLYSRVIHTMPFHASCMTVYDNFARRCANLMAPYDQRSPPDMVSLLKNHRAVMSNCMSASGRFDLAYIFRMA